MRKLTIEEIRADAARRGGRCLDDTYLGSLALMEWECGEGHRWRATAHSVRQGHWCKRCADARLRFRPELVSDVAAARGGRCVSPYQNSATKMEWGCAAGHRFFATLTAVKQGRWCPECAGRGAKRARNVRSWISAVQTTPLPAENDAVAEPAHVVGREG